MPAPMDRPMAGMRARGRELDQELGSVSQSMPGFVHWMTGPEPTQFEAEMPQFTLVVAVTRGDANSQALASQPPNAWGDGGGGGSEAASSYRTRRASR